MVERVGGGARDAVGQRGAQKRLGAVKLPGHASVGALLVGGRLEDLRKEGWNGEVWRVGLHNGGQGWEGGVGVGVGSWEESALKFCAGCAGGAGGMLEKGPE